MTHKEIKEKMSSIEDTIRKLTIDSILGHTNNKCLHFFEEESFDKMRFEEQIEFRVDRYYSDRIYDFNDVYLMSIEGSKIVTIDDWGEYDNLDICYIHNIDFLMNTLNVIENKIKS
jgi:hypothetical protein